MFNNIGKKVKKYLVACCWITWILNVIAWIVFLVIFYKSTGMFMSTAAKVGIFFAALLILLVLLFAVYIISLMSMCLAEITLKTEQLYDLISGTGESVKKSEKAKVQEEKVIIEEKDEVPEELKF